MQSMNMNMIIVILYLINSSCDDCSEGAKNDPDGWRDKREANKVDVVVHSIEYGWQEELE